MFSGARRPTPGGAPSAPSDEKGGSEPVGGPGGSAAGGGAAGGGAAVGGAPRAVASAATPIPQRRPAMAAQVADAAPADAKRPQRFQRLRRFAGRHDRALLLAVAVLAAVAIVLGHGALQPPAQRLTQEDIDAAVMHTLQTKPLPSAEARAAAIVMPSVVRVRRLGTEAKDGETEGVSVDKGVGTGVVIMENGTILTNLHVVSGAERIGVVFADGTLSDATVVSVQPENDLAVLKARSLPDDLVPATLRSTADLMPGDHVVAVGFPFGIGPTVTSGVISGLQQEYRAPGGERSLSNLIQFDAAANPGNSGGPLVTADGEVVGIVTAIFNPSEQRVFIGIGFAVPIESAASAAGLSPF